MKNLKINRTFDPGAGIRYAGHTKRVINKDGSFNIRRTGGGFNPADLYTNLVQMRWSKFLLIIFTFYFVLNGIFAGLYYFVGVNHLKGADFNGNGEDFYNAFFFSVQTFTTVGYGGMSPNGVTTNIIAGVEAAVGLMSFAIITGLLYGRFSRPNTRILYSNNLLISPYGGGEALMFRMVNMRNDHLMEAEARVMCVFTEQRDGEFNRVYHELKLERSELLLFPLTWTVVHPIDDESPLKGMDRKEIEKKETEVMVIMKAFDQTFSQVVHSRNSYRAEEWVWGARFTKAFRIDEDGDIEVALRDVHNYEAAPLPATEEERLTA